MQDPNMRYIKVTLKKSSDMQMALLNIRATPVDAKLPSLAEMLLDRTLATLLPSRSELGVEKHRDRIQERQTEMMKDQHDKTSRKEDNTIQYNTIQSNLFQLSYMSIIIIIH